MLRLDFLRLYATEDVVLKRLWPAEELCFGPAHLHARIEFEGNHVQCADEIRKLEKSVFGRADSLCELYGARVTLWGQTPWSDFAMFGRRSEYTMGSDPMVTNTLSFC